VKGIATPIAMMEADIAINGQDARLCRKGIRLVRMMWMMSVCVSRLSTNHPVWNRLALCAAAWGVDVSQQLKMYNIMK